MRRFLVQCHRCGEVMHLTQVGDPLESFILAAPMPIQKPDYGKCPKCGATIYGPLTLARYTADQKPIYKGTSKVYEIREEERESMEAIMKALQQQVKAAKAVTTRESEYITRCWKCEKWRNFTLRPNDEAKPEDMGLCCEYSIVKDACGYCDMGKEKKDD